MTRRNRKSNKRKKSSDSSELDPKCQRQDNGGPSEGEPQTVSQTVSDLIKEVRSTLYSDSEQSIVVDGNCSLDNSVCSVFEESSDETKKMAEKAGNPASESEGSNSSDRVRKPSQTSLDDVMTLLTAMNGQMQQINKRLEKLESLEGKVDNFEKDMKSEINKLWCHVNDSCKKLGERVDRVENRVEENAFASGKSADKVSQLEKECSRAKEDLLYVQSQSMRNNLLFRNLPEEKDETPETTEKILRAFLVEKLKLAQGIVDEMRFERVHRTGQPGRSGGRARSIVAKFNYFKDREVVRKQSFNLKNTDFYTMNNIHETLLTDVRNCFRK